MTILKNSNRLPHYLIILIVGALTLLPGNGALPLIDRDEPRFTQATREMVQRSEWFVPYFNGEYRFDKPVMTYWLMRGCFIVFGDNEFAARFYSVISSLLVAFLIYEFARRYFSSFAGLLGALGWLTSFQVLLHGRLAVADMPMVFAVALCHVALYELLFGSEEKRGRWFWIFYFGLAFGFLSKGPIAILCPVLTLVLYRLALWRKPLQWGNLRVVTGFFVALALVAVWGVPALLKTHGLFWKIGMNEHVVQRGLESFNSRFFLPFYYIPTAFLSLFPWIAFLGFAWGYLRKNWNQETAFLVSWALAPYIIFSLYATQLPHYVLPAFPAIFLILGRAVEIQLEGRNLRSWFFWVAIGLGVVLAGFLFGLATGEGFTEASLPLKGILLSLVGIFAGFISAALLVKNHYIRGAGISILVIAVSFHFLGKHVRELSLGVQLKPVFQSMPADADRVFHGFEEPSIVYYSDAKWHIGNVDHATLSARGSRMFLLLTREVRLEDYAALKLPKLIKKKNRQTEVLSDETRASLVTNGYRCVSVRGLNLARISWAEAELWYRQ